VERPFLDLLQAGHRDEQDAQSTPRPGRDPLVAERRDGDEPELEGIREEQQECPLVGDFEGDEADQAKRIEGDRDGPCRAGPAEADPQEQAQVDLIEPLVEALVIGDAAEIQQVAQKEIAQVDEDREETAEEWPAQDREEPTIRNAAMTRTSRVTSGAAVPGGRSGIPRRGRDAKVRSRPTP
jgi:hypothetical protein